MGSGRGHGGLAGVGHGLGRGQRDPEGHAGPDPRLGVDLEGPVVLFGELLGPGEAQTAARPLLGAFVLWVQ